MTGFRLGTADGARLGTSDGGTLGNPLGQWTVAGQTVPELITETATHQSLTLTWRVTTDRLLDRLRTLKPDEGKVDLLTTDDGGFTAVDRADGDNTFALEPPFRRRPLRQAGDYHVKRYEESLVSAEVEEWDVTAEFAPASNRTDEPGLSLRAQGVPMSRVNAGGRLGTAGGFRLGTTDGATLSNPGGTVPDGWWSLTTRYGELATDRVTAEFLGTGQDGVERFELVMTLEFDQAWLWEAALARLDGMRVRQVDDGTNVAVDDTDDDANTVTVAPPDTDDVVTDGDYVVTEWESTRTNRAFQEVSAVIASKG